MEEELRATAQVVTDRETKLQTKDRELLGLQEAMLERDDAGTAQGKKQLQLEFPPDRQFLCQTSCGSCGQAPPARTGDPKGWGWGSPGGGGEGEPPTTT